uniref:Uncharacterized protein n=1 Tax=Arundo donax TaxID=35708 RepID=A0A0A8XX24_ARUDO
MRAGAALGRLAAQRPAMGGPSPAAAALGSGRRAKGRRLGFFSPLDRNPTAEIFRDDMDTSTSDERDRVEI